MQEMWNVQEMSFEESIQRVPYKLLNFMQKPYGKYIVLSNIEGK